MKEQTELRHGERCSPAACAAAGRHGDAKDSPMVLCEHCWTIRWNGVDLCAKKVSTSSVHVKYPDGKYRPAKHNICTRPKDHGGPCKSNKLEKSYTPS